ncbi:MAG: hypothetical protein UW69_C0022G0004 [Microgenomates group bacterium GW2011_GWA2_44_7]|nr:MAG: hypothetical protein UW69_C0022G0004 [Microgenomates group bacterium GW2011_GWA2_44_7]KKT78203.1 MAG: hypothetical protein UW73_C0005G0028 [Microgenomates group bacterium GW2011_GWB1_44_8]
MEITIATLEDVTGIAKVHVETWQKYYRGQVPDFYLDSLSVEKRVHKLEEMLASGESETISLVAKENGRVIGFCDVGPSRDKDATAKTGELYAIYVLPGEMGRGVGSQLMKRVLNILMDRGFTEATLWVFKSNGKTRRFYKQRGWSEDGATKITPKDGFSYDEVRYNIRLGFPPISSAIWMRQECVRNLC